MNVVAVLLAAGASSRLGQPKQLLPIHGRPLVRAMAEVALGSRCSRLVVVVGAHAAEVRAALATTRADVVDNPRWAEGMGTSIAAGVAEAARDPACHADAVLLFLCDQPALTTAHLDRLVATFARTGTAVASRYDDVLGVPAMLPRPTFARLVTLSGASGARGFLREESWVAAVDWPEGAVDLDTPADVARWLPEEVARPAHAGRPDQ